MPNDMDIDVEIPEDDFDDEDLQEDADDADEVSKGSDIDVEELAESKAAQMLNNTLANLAIQDPEFAEYLRRRSGVEPEGKAMDIPKKTKVRNAEIPEEIAETLSEMETNHLRQIEQLKWERDQEKFEDFFESDPTLSNMAPELSSDLMRNALQGYAVELSSNPKASPKQFLKNFKKVVEGIQNNGVNSYISKRKKANQVPVSPRDLLTGFKKEEEFKPSKDALKKGEVRTHITKLLKKMGFS